MLGIWGKVAKVAKVAKIAAHFLKLRVEGWIWALLERTGGARVGEAREMRELFSMRGC